MTLNALLNQFSYYFESNNFLKFKYCLFYKISDIYEILCSLVYEICSKLEWNNSRILLKRHFFDLRSIFAVLSRTFDVIFCICILFYYWTLMSSKFVPICGQLLFLFIGKILALFFNKVKHYSFEALSLRRLAAESLSTLRRRDL